MADLSKTSSAFFQRMSNNPVPSQTPANKSPWQYVMEYFQGNPQAQAGMAQQVKASPTPINSPPVDPYMNFANKATGKPHR